MQHAALLKGLEIIPGLVERYAFFEDFYLRQKKALRGRLQVKITTLLRNLYESILPYLLETAIYYHRENVKRILHALVPTNEFEQRLIDIENQDKDIRAFEIMTSDFLKSDREDLAEQDRCLAKLPYAADAAFDSFYRQYEPYCVPNTRVELLCQLKEWSLTGDECIFWLSGMAGTGKSTIARIIAKTFSNDDRLGGSFFFPKGGGDLAHANKFVGTLAYQLANVSPPLKSLICEVIAGETDIVYQGLCNQWKVFILQPLLELGTTVSQSVVLALLDFAVEIYDQYMVLSNAIT
ncbi:MAG: WD_REPEATS_REGION domain-containing protein [Icmadophila ericetorum]|nr:WD_REPEATS_REGION domain-containing protein [Icmadophila ericetorum]